MDAVALVGLVDALLQVVALELGGRASDWRAVLFICVVETVVVTVAFPRLRYAVPRTLACELQTNKKNIKT